MAASRITGTYVDPKTAKTLVGDWCDTWLAGYATRRASTVRQARVHIARIKTEFGKQTLASVRPSQVRSWTARLRDEGLSVSYVYALHNRLAQIMADAGHDGIIARSPCSRRTSPGAGKQRAFVATTEQVWALYDAIPARMRVAILLGAFAGLRTGEACGARREDIDYMRGIVRPRVQYPAEPLKTDTSRNDIPIPRSLALQLSAHVAEWPGETLLTDRNGKQLAPWALERAVRSARKAVRKCAACDAISVRRARQGFRCPACGGDRDESGLPSGFRFHDLRHYFASLLIASGEDVKVVQARLRHASAKTTLDIYGHLWPDKDESSRAATDAVVSARFQPLNQGEEQASSGD